MSDLEIHAALAAMAARERDPAVVRGIGEDAAVVRAGGELWAVKVDPTIEGIHFRRGFRVARALANKALGRAASDFAAVGAKPRFALVSLELPARTPRRFALELVTALRTAASAIGARLIGGHTAIPKSGGALAVHVTLLGPCHGAPRSRRGARAGDRILVTGHFGGSILGGHLRPRPRLAESRALSAIPIHASIDVSDGLLLDLSRLARASGVRIDLDPRRIPIAPAARRLSRTSGKSPLSHALDDGEDYELALAVSPGRVREAMSVAHRQSFRLSIIGICRPGRGVWLREPGGDFRSAEPGGYVQRSKPPAR